MQVCQLDETEIDVAAVDGDGTLLTRVWIVVLVDVLTHMILGYWLWPRSPNREAIGLCIQHAIRPKARLFERLAITATDVFGRPELIIMDRAAWYKALEHDESLQNLRIKVKPQPGEPHVRNVVERLQGSINQQLRKAPGQTGRSVSHRGTYPSAARACVTFEDIDEAVAITCFRICNGEMDEKTLKRPDLEWRKHEHLIPRHLLDVDWEDVHLAFLPEVEKSLQSGGIRHFSTHYWDDADARLAELYENRGRHTLRVKVNRNDVSHLYLHHPDRRVWIPVPRADGDLRKLTEWESKAERAARRREAETSWQTKAQDRERVDGVFRRAAARKPRTRKEASDAKAAEVAREAPRPLAAEMDANRARGAPRDLGDLPATDEFYEEKDWSST